MISRKVVFTSFLIFAFSFNAQSQNIEYARQIIDTLTSSFFSGRGAVDDGEQKAAQFIAKEFKKMGLQPFTDDYMQNFQYSINSFPGVIKVEVGEKQLVPGKDFLVDPKSAKTYGNFDLIWYSAKNVPHKKQLKKLVNQRFFENKFIVLDDLSSDEKTEEWKSISMNSVGAAGLIFLENEKLTHRISTTVSDYVTLKVMRNEFPKDAKTISIEIEQEFIPNYTSQNVIGKIKGVEHPDSIIIISAHYDHLGKMGKDVFFPGANDNTSGISMMLNLAYHYTHKEPPKKTMVFMAFGAEESGLLGSKYFTEHPLFALEQINFMINVDIMGTGDEGIQVVNGSVFKNHFDKLVKINEEEQLLKQIKIRGKAANSDHYWFSEKGVPAFFIYTLGGITAYHDIYDVSKTLPLTEFEDCYRLIKIFVDDL